MQLYTDSYPLIRVSTNAHCACVCWNSESIFCAANSINHPILEGQMRKCHENLFTSVNHNSFHKQYQMSQHCPWGVARSPIASARSHSKSSSAKRIGVIRRGEVKGVLERLQSTANPTLD